MVKYKDAELTTLCYIENEDSYLMLHRVKKEHDINKDKWIGLGGHFEKDESPDDCLKREVLEESGLSLSSYRMRGIVTFISGDGCTEYMHLYTAKVSTKIFSDCDEGCLEWIKKDKVYDLNLWEGDKIFFKLLADNEPFFSLKLEYDGHGKLLNAVLNGKDMELLDILNEDGSPSGQVSERNVAHMLGYLHQTVHMWIVKDNKILVQKRSKTKDSNPGCYDISSAGHISAGQTVLDAAIRELSEELGLLVDEKDLRHIGFTKRCILKPFYGKFWPDNQISQVFVIEKDVDINSLKLQKSEVEEVSWMDLDELIKTVEEDDSFPNCFNPEELKMLRRSLHS